MIICFSWLLDESAFRSKLFFFKDSFNSSILAFLLWFACCMLKLFLELKSRNKLWDKDKVRNNKMRKKYMMNYWKYSYGSVCIYDSFVPVLGHQVSFSIKLTLFPTLECNLLCNIDSQNRLLRPVQPSVFWNGLFKDLVCWKICEITLYD